MPRTVNLHSNIAAFLDMLAFSEGTVKFGNDDGYNVIVGGTLFKDYSKHPNISVKLPKLGIFSTAAGRYQLLGRYWVPYKMLLRLNDFSPISQDAIAIRMIREQKAYADIVEGRFSEAISKCHNIWASLPGAGYGQHEHSLGRLLAEYLRCGGFCA